MRLANQLIPVLLFAGGSGAAGGGGGGGGGAGSAGGAGDAGGGGLMIGPTSAEIEATGLGGGGEKYDGVSGRAVGR